MPSVTSRTSDTLELVNLEPEEKSLDHLNLLNTIRVPRDLGQITERLPKPQYGIAMRRNKSLPPEKIEKLPDIAAKKESLPHIPLSGKQRQEIKVEKEDIQVQPMNIQPRRIIGGLGNKGNHHRQLSELAIIEEDEVPPSRKETRQRSR